MAECMVRAERRTDIPGSVRGRYPYLCSHPCEGEEGERCGPSHQDYFKTCFRRKCCLGWSRTLHFCILKVCSDNTYLHNHLLQYTCINRAVCSLYCPISCRDELLSIAIVFHLVTFCATCNYLCMCILFYSIYVSSNAVWLTTQNTEIPPKHRLCYLAQGALQQWLCNPIMKKMHGCPWFTQHLAKSCEVTNHRNSAIWLSQETKRNKEWLHLYLATWCERNA